MIIIDFIGRNLVNDNFINKIIVNMIYTGNVFDDDNQLVVYNQILNFKAKDIEWWIYFGREFAERAKTSRRIYPSRGVFCFNPMPSSYMSKNRMLLWAKKYVFVSINSRDLVITELPEESTFCFDQSQCSIAARRWINSESLFGPFTCRFTLLGRLKIP